MNYYERYCGDYSRDTAHLSLAEHGAYTLLLDAYYSTEKPFSTDYQPLYRICRAMSKIEQAAVRAVADEFFPVGADGLRHNSRADRDIPKAHKRIDAVRTNGKKGGRPHKPRNNLAGSENETKQEPTRFPENNLLGTLRETYSGEALPDPRPQHPPTEKQKPGGRVRGKPLKSPLPADFHVSERVAEWAADKGYDRLPEYLEAFLGKVASGGLTYADWDAAFMNSIREDWGKVRERTAPILGGKRLAL